LILKPGVTQTEPIGYEVVCSFMIHGPCRPHVPCMTDASCSKFYPKQFIGDTTILENGFAQYAHPNNGLDVLKMGLVLTTDSLFLKTSI
jgi:hypothetical protein